MTGPALLVLVDPEEDVAALLSPLLVLHPEAHVVEPHPGAADLSVRMCAAVNDLAPRSPMVIISVGRASLLLPAIARSQHASHRCVSEYLLIEPILPTVTDAWPDSRVTLVCEPTTEASLQGRLRGWDIMSPDGLHRWEPSD